MRVRRLFESPWLKPAPLVVLCAAISAGLLHGAAPSVPAGPGAIAAATKPQKTDPIQTNGAIFVDWPKPNVALLFTGEQDGYLEPCGCAGLENQKGGLKRRFTMIKELRDKGWPVVPVDAGDQERNTGIQAGMKLDFSYRALARMGYAAVGFGENDLKLDLLSIALNLDQATNPLVSTNVAIVDYDSGFTKRYKIIDQGGMRIGITTVLGSRAIAHLRNLNDVAVKDPNQGIPEIMADLINAKCDQLVLVANAEPDEAKALAVKFKDFNWVMATHGAEVPPGEPVKIKGANSYLIEVGQKAEYAVVVGLYKDGKPAFRYQRVPLDHRFSDAPEIYNMQVEYLHGLQNLGLSGLGLKPTPHPTGRKFVGSKTCADCHTQAAAVYEKTPHAHATETLEKRTDPPRIYDPECLSCHVTGWEPQKYFPFESGYTDLKETPNLVGNGCENCHGPAARHAAAENGDVEATPAEMEELRAALRLKILPNEGNKPGQVYDKGKVVQMCMQCHDLDNSPEFDFQKYWPKVKHVGKD
jgi:hypothetical protein